MTVQDVILARLDEQGPIDLHVTEEEYGWLHGRAKALWLHADYWSARDQRLFLAFLRGYTFYREVSENENQFWATFHAEFRMGQGLPTKTQYDTLWTALLGHPVTAAHCHVTQGDYRTRRHFVRAIDSIWGIRSLSARQLMSFFDGYYNSFPGQPIDAALMRRLLPDADDATLRQAAAYDRLFRRMVRIVDHILETDPTLAALPPDELTRHLVERGIEVGSPNPVLYFANTTESGLARIVGLASHGTRHRYHFSALRTRVRNTHPYAEAHLAPGYALEGQPVVLQLQDRVGTTRQEVEIRLAGGQRARVLHGAATFNGLPRGHHVGELLVAGRAAGRSVEFTVLPEMSWVLSHRDGPLVEGQWQVGTVTLSDGRFGRFRWRPQWNATPTGFAPATTRVRADLDDDLSVELDVCAQSYGARILDPVGPHVVERLTSPERLGGMLIRPLQPQKVAPPAIRVSWGSRPEQPCDATEGRHLRDLALLSPETHDELIVEMRHGTAWYRVLAVPIEVAPTLEHVTCEANALRLLVRGTGTADIVVQEEVGQQVFSHTHTVRAGQLQSVALQCPDLWAPRTIRVDLTFAECVVATREVQHAPRQDVRGQLRELLVQGLGWSRVSTVAERP